MLGLFILNHATSANFMLTRHEDVLPVTLNHSAKTTSHSACVHMTLVLWIHSAQFCVFTLFGNAKQQLLFRHCVGPDSGSSDLRDVSAGTHVCGCCLYFKTCLRMCCMILSSNKEKSVTRWPS